MGKLIYNLVVLLLSATSFSLIRSELFISSAASKQDTKVDSNTKAKRAFPVAEFNEPDSASVAGDLKQQKRKRYDAFKFVASKPEPWVAERVISSEGLFSLPALPVTESDVILVAVVSSSEAHVSGNRKGVFSEFDLAVESVLKSQDIKDGSRLTVDRLGGYVKYPNGQQILFRFGGVNMPQVGSRYLFFLSTKRKPDLTIMTAYELTDKGVIPLDLSSQFLALEGITETELRIKVRDLLAK